MVRCKQKDIACERGLERNSLPRGRSNNTIEETSLVGHAEHRLAPNRDGHACRAETVRRAQLTPEGVPESREGGDTGDKTGPVMIA